MVCLLLSMGVSMESLDDPFFEANDLLPKKIEKIQENYIKNHGLWSEKK